MATAINPPAAVKTDLKRVIYVIEDPPITLSRSLQYVFVANINSSSNNTNTRVTPTTGQIYPRSKMWKD